MISFFLHSGFFFFGESEAGCSLKICKKYKRNNSEYILVLQTEYSGYYIEAFDCTGSDGPSGKLKLRLSSMCMKTVVSDSPSVPLVIYRMLTSIAISDPSLPISAMANLIFL